MRPHVTESDLAELLCDHQSGHSDLQIDRFIVEKGNWTPYGRYKQCLREIDGRYRNLQSMREDFELAELDLQEAEEAMRREEAGSPQHTRFRIARDRQQRALIQCRRAIADQSRELTRFVRLAQGLKGQVGDLSPERRAAMDEELWSVRARAMVALDLFTQGTISAATAELLIALPAEVRKPILAAAQNAEANGGLFDWLTDGPKVLEE